MAEYDDPAEVERPRIKFADVGGMEHVKEEIRLKIIYPIPHADLYKTAGGGLLLYGHSNDGERCCDKSLTPSRLLERCL